MAKQNEGDEEDDQKIKMSQNGQNYDQMGREEAPHYIEQQKWLLKSSGDHTRPPEEWLLLKWQFTAGGLANVKLKSERKNDGNVSSNA